VKVLHVSKFSTITGGVERHLWDLIEAQRSDGISAELFSSETVFDGEVELEPRGRRLSEKLAIGANVMWSRRARRAFEVKVQQFGPDVVHYHSIYHQLSPSVLPPSRVSWGSVMTLHDFKLAAPCYVLTRDGAACTECVGKWFPTGAIRYRCVKGSFAASALCSAEQLVHRPRYRRRIDRFIVPSNYSARILAMSGAVEPDTLRVVPHGVATRAPNPRPSASEELLFIGRLSPEKGVLDLLKAWRAVCGRLPFNLTVIGDGPEMSSAAAAAPEATTFVGWRSKAEVDEALSRARAVVVPSRSCETFGLVAAEAMSAGVPVVVSDAGALPELIEKSGAGVVYPAGDVEALASALMRIGDADAADTLGQAGLRFARAHLGVREMSRSTLGVYQEAIESRP
jgi:glycosyltransferase involved in cell wall biosynthesis